MKPTTSFLLTALAAFTSAQNPGDLPPDLPACAQSCAEPYFSADGTTFATCFYRDVACVCSQSSFITDISCCIATNCSAADQQTTIAFAQNLCSQVSLPGTPPLPSTAICASTSSSTPIPTPSPAYKIRGRKADY